MARSLQHVGPYRILGLLGEGGMGKVFRAEHETLQRPVALKVLSDHVANDPGFADRFIREARAVALIDHPHVVRCYDAGRSDDTLFLALEWMTGGDAAGLLEQGCSVQRAVDVVTDCAAGLVAIEQAGLVHRDIKPANIFLDGQGRAKLADLGLARRVDGEDAMTVPGMPIGTPSYMAPEQARGEEDCGITADIYALGATLFCLLSGRPPFVGKSPIDTLTMACHQPAPSLASVGIEADSSIEELIATCLAKEASDRFIHAADLHAAMLKVGLPETGRHLSSTYDGNDSRSSRDSSEDQTLPANMAEEINGSSSKAGSSGNAGKNGNKGILSLAAEAPPDYQEIPSLKLNKKKNREDTPGKSSPESPSSSRHQVDQGSIKKSAKQSKDHEHKQSQNQESDRRTPSSDDSVKSVIKPLNVGPLPTGSTKRDAPGQVKMRAGQRLNVAQLNRLSKRVHVTEDGLEAWLNLAPGTTFPRNLLEVVLEHAGIIYGIEQRALSQASRREEVARRLVIANGDPASPGIAGKDVYGKAIDGGFLSLVIRTDSTGLKAHAIVRPGKLVPRDMVEHQIRTSGLCYGLEKDAIKSLWHGPASNSGQVLIAQGKPAVEWFPGGFIVEEESNQQIGEANVGDIVARWREPIDGHSGMTVMGVTMPVTKLDARRPESCLGEGVALGRDSGGYLVAKANQKGYVRARPDGVVAVWPAVEVGGNLGPDQPAVDTDHLVVVRGDVLPGAKIHSSADVVIMGNLHDAEIAAGGTIEVHGDVVAGDEDVAAGESVVVNGDLNRGVVAGSLRISGCLRDCAVRVTGDIHADHIVGGSVVCGGNLTCREAGDSEAQKTDLWAGHQPSVSDQQMVQELAERRMSVERESLLERASRDRKQLAAIMQAQERLKHSAYRNDKAVERYAHQVEDLSRQRDRLAAECERSRAQLARQRKQVKALKHLSDNPDAVVAITDQAYRGVSVRVADADAVLVRQPGPITVDLK